MGKFTISMGKFTISMVISHSYVLVYQMVLPLRAASSG